MDYEKALKWVHSLPRLAKSRDIICMKNLMHALGDPQKRLKFVHVAGTNGKGSLVSMSASVLKTAGYKVGMNVSPYVLGFCERFMINGEMVGRGRIAEIFTRVRVAAETLRESPLEFEVVTAAALLYFAQEACDIVCIETGLGGRLDATNVIPAPIVACIGRIGFDHTELLGDTLAEIAAEKCGIIKSGSAVISYPQQKDEAQGVIFKVCKKLECSLVTPATGSILFSRKEKLCHNMYYKGYNIVLPFLGKHQSLNAAMVVEAMKVLTKEGFEISDDDIITGIETAHFPARIEVLRKEPLLILDGAHNVDSAQVLVDTLKLEKISNLTIVLGVMKDKNVDEIIKTLAPITQKLYAVKPKNIRAMEAEQLASVAREYIPSAIACESLTHALLLVKKENADTLICGSFYLAAEVRPMFVNK